MRTRNNPLPGLCKNSPMKNKLELVDHTPKPKTGTVSTGGGVGLLVDSAKKTFAGYGKTNPQIVKDARMMPGKI
tara:strand:- start:1454 stop:1675 length:222 start_codon:yes stop_codon:yes gene_type:complete